MRVVAVAALQDVLGRCYREMVAVSDSSKLLVLGVTLVASLLVALGIAQVVGLRSSGSAAESVRFADPHLERALRSLFWGSGAPFDAEHLAMIKEFRARGRGVEDLRGLEYCTGLERLDLSGNKTVDIGPLSQLGELRTVYLADNRIRDLQPLADLRWLADLDLSGNGIVDVNPLADLTRLVHLDLSGNDIHDVSSFRYVDSLITLDLSENKIASLSGMPEVRPCGGPGMKVWVPARGQYVTVSCSDPTIDLSDNLIQDLSPLLWLDEDRAGQAVDVSGNLLDLADGSPAREVIRKLEGRGIQVCY